MKVLVRSPSRLHFGLMGLGDQPGRAFGGVGLMIDTPGLVLTAQLAPSSEVVGFVPSAIQERAARLLNRLTAEHGLPNMEVVLSSVADEHIGLGTGTQLSLAITAAAFQLAGREVNPVALAQASGRGLRSGIGLHGFFSGGLVVDAGRSAKSPIPTAVAHATFPPEWVLAIITPDLPIGIHGEQEASTIAEAKPFPPAMVDRLASLVLLQLLPALHERDFDAFSKALREYNFRVGEGFSRLQGGPYAHPKLGEWIERLRSWGIEGVGQSSWGPTFFALFPSEQAALVGLDRLESDEPELVARIRLARASPSGARIEAVDV